MKLQDVMTQDPVTVRPDTRFKKLVDVLIEHDIGALPVVDDSGALVGIVTESDLTSTLAYTDERRGVLSSMAATLTGRRPTWPKMAAGMTAREIMTDRVVSGSPQEDLHHAARRMVEHGFGHLPVIADSGELIGMVARRDMLRPFRRSDQEIAEDVRRILDDGIRFERGLDVSVRVDDGKVILAGSVNHPHEVTTLSNAVGDVAGVVQVENGAKPSSRAADLR